MRLTVVARRMTGRGSRATRRAPAGPRLAARSARPHARRTDPAPQHPSNPQATTAERHPHRGKTRGPRPTSDGSQRTRTPAPPTDGTDASHELAAHRRHQAQLTALDNALAE